MPTYTVFVGNSFRPEWRDKFPEIGGADAPAAAEVKYAPVLAELPYVSLDFAIVNNEPDGASITANISDIGYIITPGFNTLMIDRNGVLVFYGVVVGVRTSVRDQGSEITIQAMSEDYVLDRTVVKTTRGFTDSKQKPITKMVMGYHEGLYTAANMGTRGLIHDVCGTYDNTSKITRGRGWHLEWDDAGLADLTYKVYHYEMKLAGDCIREIAGIPEETGDAYAMEENSFDWGMEFWWDENGFPRNRFKLWRPGRGRRPPNYSTNDPGGLPLLHYSHGEGGNCLPESIEQSLDHYANNVYGAGSGEGATTPTAAAYLATAVPRSVRWGWAKAARYAGKDVQFDDQVPPSQIYDSVSSNSADRRKDWVKRRARATLREMSDPLSGISLSLDPTNTSTEVGTLETGDIVMVDVFLGVVSVPRLWMRIESLTTSWDGTNERQSVSLQPTKFPTKIFDRPLVAESENWDDT